MPKGRPNKVGSCDKIVARKKAAFLKALEACGGVVRKACREMGLSCSTVYEWCRRDAEFAEAWDRAALAGVAVLEEEIYRRGVEGVKKPVYQGGELVGYTHDYSDVLLIFAAKAANPLKYRENKTIVANAPGEAFRVEISDKERAERAARILAAAAARVPEGE